MAAALDLVIGDPPAWPHPVRAIAALAALAEKKYRAFFPGLPMVAGIFTTGTTLFGSMACLLLLFTVTARIHPALFAACALLLLASSLALHDLLRHSREVLAALRHNDLPLARTRLQMIVGRDTHGLTREEIVRATVESVAENLVDGVLAPFFYGTIGAVLVPGPAGPVLGAWGYKTINTMDSLFGYKNKQYEKFGTCAARLDDVANFIPARLSIAAIAMGAWLCRLPVTDTVKTACRDRRKHASPNAAHPEAAFAGALGIELGGPARYSGQLVAKPVIGNACHPPSPSHIHQANRLLLYASLAGYMFFLALGSGCLLVLPHVLR